MLITGIVLAAAGIVTTGTAIAMEVKYKEPIYLIMMKVGTAFFGIGGVMFGIASCL